MRAATTATLTEKELSAHVTYAAKQLGWSVYHAWLSAHSESGWPDIVCLRRGRMIVAELKRDGRVPTAPQEHWLDEFRWLMETANVQSDVVQVYVFTPADWHSGLIERVLDGVEYLDWLESEAE